MDLMYRAVQIFFAVLFWFLGHTWFRLEVRGTENLRGLKKGPLIMAPNHKSWIDHFLILAALPSWRHSPFLPIRAMAGQKLFKIPVLNLLLKALGTYPSHKGEGIEVALQTPVAILEDKGIVGIYPEGKRIFSDELGEFKRGAAELAKRVPEVVFLPIIVWGTHDMHFQVLPKFFRTVRVFFGEPFKVDPELSSDIITAELRERMRIMYIQTRQTEEVLPVQKTA